MASLLDVPSSPNSLRQDLRRGFTLEQALERLSPAQRERLESIHDRAGLRDLADLAGESSLPLLLEGVFQHAGRLENADRIEEAERIYSSLASLRLDGLSALQDRVEERRRAIAGTGDFAPRAEFLARRLLSHAMDPATLAGMAVAGPIFRAARLFALGRLAASPTALGVLRPWGARGLANTFGFAAETLGFSGAVRGVDALRGRSLDWSAAALSRELAGGALTLGSLRLSGALGRSFLRRVSLRPAWGTPFAAAAVPQLAMLGGLLLSRHIEEASGLREAAPDGATRLTDAMATLLQFNIAGRAVQGVLGGRLRAMDLGFERRSRGLESSLALAPAGAAAFAAPSWSSRLRRAGETAFFAPFWLMMGVGGGGGGGMRPRAENSESAEIEAVRQAAQETPVMRFQVPAPEVPGPRRLIPVLAAFQYILDPVSFGRALPPGESGVRGAARGSGGMVVVHGPDLIREVFTNRETWLRPRGGFTKPPATHPHIDVMLHNLLFMNGENWRVRRRVLMPPATKASVMAQMPATFLRTAEEISGEWKPGDTIDITHQALRITLRNNLRGLMGLEPEVGEPIADLMQQFTDGVVSPRVATSQTLSLGRVIPGTSYARWIRAGEELSRRLAPVIEHKRANPSNDALGSLVASIDEATGRPLSNEALIGELVGFYGAGYESTAQTLGWTTWLLAQHPQVAERAAREVADVLQGRPPTQADIAKLRYLDDVVHEAQRVISIVPTSLPRTTTQEVRLGGVTLPPGSNVTVSIIAQHHNPRIFESPGRFLPERWESLRNSGENLTYHFMPFGVGPRRCLGGVFAALQLRTTLAHLLQRYSFVPVRSKIDYRVNNILVMPRDALPLQVNPVGNWRETPAPTGTITRLLYSNE